MSTEKKTIFEQSLIQTQKRVNKVNIDLFNSHKSESVYSNKLNLNRMFKVEHYGLNSVLKTLQSLYGKPAFINYNKSLLNEKGFKIEKTDLTFKAVKNLFPSATFYINEETQRTYICRFKKIDSIDEASILIGSFSGLNGKEYNIEIATPYYEYIETQDSDGSAIKQLYTIVPRESFTGWQILTLIAKFKEFKKEKEKETETETDN